MRTLQEHNRVSAVIPTLNAAAELTHTLATLKDSALIGEVVIVDGGSQDDTVAIAREAGAKVIEGSRGRGSQLVAGGAAAKGEWLLFLHADCRPLPGWEGSARMFIAGSPDKAGYFDLALDDGATMARSLERVAAWRSHALALPYGDQGLLISRRLYNIIGGYAAMPLMEDVDIVRRLGRARLQPIGATMLASARRYRRDGYWRRPLRNLMCLALYFAGVPPHRIAKLYG